MDDGQFRVGDDERDAAKRLLAQHHEAGRLDADEFEDRRGRAGDAVMRADLDELFTDLPSAPVATVGQSAAASPGRPSAAPTDRWKTRRGALSGIISLGAVVLFFATGRWQWFLLIPLVALLWTLFTGREDD